MREDGTVSGSEKQTFLEFCPPGGKMARLVAQKNEMFENFAPRREDGRGERLVKLGLAGKKVWKQAEGKKLKYNRRARN